MSCMRPWHRVAMRFLPVLLLCVPASGRVPHAREQASRRKSATHGVQAEAPKMLRKGQTVRFPLPAPTATSAWNYCAEGDAYLMYTAAKPVLGPGPIIPPSIAGQPITKLSLGSRTATKFTPGSVDGYTSLALMRFSVDREGDVYGFYVAQPSPLKEGAARGPRYLIVRYGSDGDVRSVVRLRNPPAGPFDPTNFAAFDDGNVLVTGILRAPGHAAGNRVPPRPFDRYVPVPTAGNRIPPGPFVGIFDHRGDFVARIKLPRGAHPIAPPAAQEGARATTGKGNAELPASVRWFTAIMNSLTVTGPADTVYFLRDSNPPRLLTLSSDGRVTRSVSIHPPQRNATPENMGVAGRSILFVQFGGMKVGKNGKPQPIYTYELISPTTGKVIAAYVLPKRAFVMPLCAAGPDDFLFIGSTKNGKLKVDNYHAP